MIHLNATYSQAQVGTGTWTRCILAAMPAWCPRRMSRDPSATGRNGFWRKIAYEAAFRRFRPGARVHPYAAVALDRDAYIVVLDTIPIDGRDGNTLHARLVRRSAREAAAVASISVAECERVEAALGRHAALLTPFPDAEFFNAPVKRRKVVVQRNVRAVYWGGNHPRKMIDQAAAELAGSGIELTVVGSSVRGAHRCLNSAPIDELIEVIDANDVVVCPSKREGFGLTVFEALLRGRPVVCRDLPSYREIVSSTSSLYFIGPELSLVEAINVAASDLGSADPRGTLRVNQRSKAIDLLRDQLSAWVR